MNVACFDLFLSFFLVVFFFIWSGKSLFTFFTGTSYRFWVFHGSTIWPNLTPSMLLIFYIPMLFFRTKCSYFINDNVDFSYDDRRLWFTVVLLGDTLTDKPSVFTWILCWGGSFIGRTLAFTVLSNKAELLKRF